LAKRRKPLVFIILQGPPVEIPLTIPPGDTSNAEILRLKQIWIDRYSQFVLKINGNGNIEFSGRLNPNCTTYVGRDDKAALKIHPRNKGNVRRGNMTNELGAIFRPDTDGLSHHRGRED